MDWILDHLQLLFFAAAAIAYWLNKRRTDAEAENGDVSAPPPRRFGGETHDPAAAERARRIQEEIRRKISERQRGLPSHPRAEPPPVPVLVRRQVAEEPPPLTPEWDADSDILARQQKLAEQLAALERRKADARREAAEVWTAPPPAAGPQPATARARVSSLARELSDKRTLRRAIVLKEVLGTPVGLR